MYNEALTAFSRAWQSLSSNATLKLMASGLVVILQFHGELVGIFTLLVFLDLFTKWLQLSYSMQKTDDFEPSLIEALRGIPEAHRQGVISSGVMKTRFIAKIMVYFLVVISAGLADGALKHFERNGVFVEMAVSYLVITEFLSIIENLNNAGVSALAGIINKLKRFL